MPTISKYYPIWQVLKSDGVCKITADVRLHARIKKAIIKRKDEDIKFKALCDESNGFPARLDIKFDGETIIFTLIYKKNVSITDL